MAEKKYFIYFHKGDVESARLWQYDDEDVAEAKLRKLKLDEDIEYISLISGKIKKTLIEKAGEMKAKKKLEEI